MIANQYDSGFRNQSRVRTTEPVRAPAAMNAAATLTGCVPTIR